MKGFELLSTVVSMFVISAGALADSQDERKIALDLAPQPLAQALSAVAEKSNIRLVLNTDDALGLVSRRLQGAFTPRAAFDALLSSSRLTYEFVDDRTVEIRSAKSTDPASEDQSSTQESKKTSLITAPADRLRLAQATVPSASREERRDPDGENTHREWEGSNLEVVVVTGTLIRGVAPAGSAVKVYSREDIEHSGVATVQQFARQMTENFSSVDAVANSYSNAKYSRATGVSGNNLFAGSGFDLHGLGPTSTLTLLDGRRLAPAGLDGSLTDSSQIPLSAIERIEVLTDGASAIYGADAVAGVVNLIPRRHFRGAELSVRYGGTSNGGASEISASQLFGTEWGSGSLMVSYEYHDQDDLDAADRDYILSQGGPFALVASERRNSVFLTAEQKLGDALSLSAIGSFSDRDFGSEHTTSGSALQIRSSAGGQVQQSVFGVNAELRLNENWHLEIGGDFSRIAQSLSGTDVLSFGVGSSTTLSAFDTASTVSSGDLLVNGSPFMIPGGRVNVAAGASYRRETFRSARSFVSGPQTTNQYVPDTQRHVSSAYAEVFLPIVSEMNRLPALERLEMSLAARHDDYGDFGSSTNPKVGLVWSPGKGLNIRGTYGGAFRAPLLSQLGSPVQYSTTLFADSASPTGVTDTLIVSGGNPALRPETARSFTMGIELRPVKLPDLHASLGYFRVRFTDRIALPPQLGPTIFDDPVLLPFITRDPSLEDVQAAFASPGFAGDSAGQGPNGVTAVFESRIANIANTRQSGIDFGVEYRWNASPARVDTAISVTRLMQNSFQTIDQLPYVQQLNVFGLPTKWKARGSIGLSLGGLSVIVAANHVNSYDNVLTTPTSRIGAWTTGDVRIAYGAGPNAQGLLRDLTVSLNVINVTDRDPPFVLIPASRLLPGQNPLPFDPTNSSPLGRTVSVQLVKGWGPQ